MIIIIILKYFRENTYINIYISQVGDGNDEVALLLVGYADEVKVCFDMMI